MGRIWIYREKNGVKTRFCLAENYRLVGGRAYESRSFEVSPQEFDRIENLEGKKLEDCLKKIWDR